jgi:hypothetical protein
MTIAERNLLIDKAKSKKDGVYMCIPYMYVVKNNSLIAYSDYFGVCYSCHGYFNVQIGKVERYDRKKALTKYLKQQ